MLNCNAMLYVPPIRGEYHPFYIQLSGSNSAVDVMSTYSVIIKTHDYPSFRKPKEPYKNDWKDENGDDEYTALGAVVVTREEALACDTIVDVKLGDADYLPELNGPHTLVGWAHTVQNVDFTSAVLDAGHTIIAWEEIYDKGRYIFYRNREIAGEAAVLQGFRFSGKMPYDAKIAIIGNGQTSKGAQMVLSGLGGGVNTDVYARKDEDRFRKNLGNYDVIINCVLWDTHRTDRLIYREDLKRMRPGTLIIDVSCDPHLEIETSHPTTIDNPVYEVDGILHYAVQNSHRHHGRQP